jgi:hypothetical protein
MFTIVKKLDRGYIIMAPDGETAYIAESQFQILKSKNKI